MARAYNVDGASLRKMAAKYFEHTLINQSITKGQIQLRCPAREQVCDQLVSWSQTASKQDNVMEYGLNRSATRFELSRHVDIARTCL